MQNDILLMAFINWITSHAFTYLNRLQKHDVIDYINILSYSFILGNYYHFVLLLNFT